MSIEWAKNLMGFSQPEEVVLKIQNPKLELYIHVTTKVVQLFTVAGSLVTGPLKAAIKPETRNLMDVLKFSRKHGVRGLFTGLVVGPAMTYARSSKFTDSTDFYDRSYRLRKNQNQVRVDRTSLGGSLVGGAIFPLFLRACPLHGALVGFSIGTISAGVYNNV